MSSKQIILCSSCGGTGRICHKCDNPRHECQCENIAGVRGYDPVVCNACQGTGREPGTESIKCSLEE